MDIQRIIAICILREGGRESEGGREGGRRVCRTGRKEGKGRKMDLAYWNAATWSMDFKAYICIYIYIYICVCVFIMHMYYVYAYKY
jgi:hypothetical protein